MNEFDTMIQEVKMSIYELFFEEPNYDENLISVKNTIRMINRISTEHKDLIVVYDELREKKHNHPTETQMEREDKAYERGRADAQKEFEAIKAKVTADNEAQRMDWRNHYDRSIDANNNLAGKCIELAAEVDRLTTLNKSVNAAYEAAIAQRDDAGLEERKAELDDLIAKARLDAAKTSDLVRENAILHDKINKQNVEFINLREKNYERYV